METKPHPPRSAHASDTQRGSAAPVAAMLGQAGRLGALTPPAVSPGSKGCAVWKLSQMSDDRPEAKPAAVVPTQPVEECTSMRTVPAKRSSKTDDKCRPEQVKEKGSDGQSTYKTVVKSGRCRQSSAAHRRECPVAKGRRSSPCMTIDASSQASNASGRPGRSGGGAAVSVVQCLRDQCSEGA